MMAVYSGDIDIYTFIQLDFFIPERIYIYIYIYIHDWNYIYNGIQSKFQEAIGLFGFMFDEHC